MPFDTENPSVAVRLAAMNLLARREHSFKELLGKLAVRFPEDIVQEQLAHLRDEKLQSDARFVESYVRFRQQKGYGPVRIRSELYQKGIEGELLNEYLLDEDDTWYQISAQLRCRKFGDQAPTDYKQRAKQQRFLMQRGFTTSQINRSFRSLDDC